MTPVSEIQTDSEDIKELLRASKDGQWDKVWRILGHPQRPHKPFLLNCIPEDRRWGVLHQAVWWNNYSVVEKLLQFATCDINIRAKECISEIGPTGKNTAKEIASRLEYTDIVELLETHARRLEGQAPQTFHLLSEECEDCVLSLLKVTLAAYKNTFFPENTKSKSFKDLLGDVWNKVNSVQGQWEMARNKVAESIYVVCETTCNKIKETEDKEGFYDAIIKAYTTEETFLYDHLNTALRRQRQDNYMPTAADLALGPFALMFQLLLLFWNELPVEDDITFRKIKVTTEELEKYQVDTKFAWMSFASSSASLEFAKQFPTCAPTGDNVIIFTITNSNSDYSYWQPRNIERYATYMEEERVFPAGAKFVVKKRFEDKDVTHISLQLLKDSSHDEFCMIL